MSGKFSKSGFDVYEAFVRIMLQRYQYNDTLKSSAWLNQRMLSCNEKKRKIDSVENLTYDQKYGISNLQNWLKPKKIYLGVYLIY